MQISEEIAQAEKSIAKAEKLKRLMENPDFIEIISDGYLKDFLTLQVRFLSNCVKEQDINTIQRKIDAIGLLDNYLHYILGSGKQAEEDLKNLKHYREQLEQEESGVHNG